MQKTIINPWQWQQNLGYSQAVEIKQSEGTLFCSGQAAMDDDGQPIAGSMTEQIERSFSNLVAVINAAGYDPSGIARINFYTTSVPDFFKSYGSVMAWFQRYQTNPASTLLQVEALAFPQLLIEIEATVLK